MERFEKQLTKFIAHLSGASSHVTTLLSNEGLWNYSL